MSFQDEPNSNELAATMPALNEVEALKRELAEAKKEAAIAGFLARASREFPSLPMSDLKALTADRLSFRDGILVSEDSAMAYLQSRPFLAPQAPPAPSTNSFGAGNAADAGAPARHAALEQRKTYLRSLFGRGSNSKAASVLGKQDMPAYRRLRDEALRLDVYGK
jgi:hypothetical protein